MPRFRPLITVLALSASGCVPAPLASLPRLPPDREQWIIPLYEPLIAPRPMVMARVQRGAPTGGSSLQRDVLLVVDSGSTFSRLPERVFKALGAPLHERAGVATEDATGSRRTARGAMIDQIRLGELSLSEVFLAEDPQLGVLGADILGQRRWELDLDRGVLIVGAPVWREGDGGSARAQRFGLHRIVQVQVAGRATPMLLDTGASLTALDEAALPKHGVEAILWPRTVRARSAFGTVDIDRFYRASFRLGTWDLGPREIVAYAFPPGEVTGLLGWDVLQGFILQVSDDSVRFRTRRPLLQTVAERLQRWPGVPSCVERPGCAAVAVASQHLLVELAADYPEPYSFLFGCLNQAGQLRQELPWLEVGVLAPRSDQSSDVTRYIPEIVRGLWLSHCSSWALLDITPARHEPWAEQGAPLHATFQVPSSRLKLSTYRY